MHPAIILAAVFCAVNIAQGMFVPNGGGSLLPRPQLFPGPLSFTIPKSGPWSPVQPKPGLTFPSSGRPIYARGRRQAGQGSINLNNLDGHPSIDYNHHIIQNSRERLDAYGGAALERGRFSPHLGFQYERNFRNGFVGGFGQIQPRPGGGVEPSFGVRAGFRF